MLYDAHNHLQDEWLKPHRERVFTDLKHIPLARAVVNGTCQQDWPEVAALAVKHAFVLPSFGLHPWNVGNATPAWRDELQHHIAHTSGAAAGVAVGEIGLDRWILERARPDDSRLAGLRRASLDEQLDAFLWQLTFAAERNLPVTIHCLDAWGALLKALRESPRPARGFLLHAYAGSVELARDFIALGAYFSFNGYFLGERQAAKRVVFGALPLDRLLVETDAPYLAPVPHRGKRNEPAYVPLTIAHLARARAQDVEHVSARTVENAARLFALAITPTPA